MLIGIYALASAAVSLGICWFTGSFGGNRWLWLLPTAGLGLFLLLCLITFLYLLYLCHKVDQNVPQEEDDPLYRTFANLLLQSVLPVLRIHIRKTGMEKVPESGRFLLVCNHCSDSDPIILMREFAKYRLAFISKKENRDMFVIGPMMHKLQCQLINRENDREALKTILRCIQILKEDKASICVFPEGYTSKDGKLHHFRNGVFKIAQKANVPIVVCTIRNTRTIFKNLAKLKKTDVEFHLVDVIPPEETKGLSTVELSDRIYECMIADLGEEFRF